jgi:hypothetical protein
MVALDQDGSGGGCEEVDRKIACEWYGHTTRVLSLKGSMYDLKMVITLLMLPHIVIGLSPTYDLIHIIMCSDADIRCFCDRHRTDVDEGADTRDLQGIWRSRMKLETAAGSYMHFKAKLEPVKYSWQGMVHDRAKCAKRA